MDFQPRLNKFWGWGPPSESATDEEVALLGALAKHRFGVTDAPLTPPTAEQMTLGEPRLGPPATLAHFVTDRRPDRLAHAAGKSFPDLARAFARAPVPAPDLVAYPADEAEVDAALDWAAREGVAVIPYGGGSSVVGGVTPDVGESYRGALTLDLQRLDRVLEIDTVSRAALIQGGVLGPHLADQLRAHNLSLRHYPQSYQYSSLGGWIATRAGGHFATGPTHIDDFVESVRVVTPTGSWETRRLPASGAGPDPNRLALGSEGSLGVITQAWMRLQETPRFRSTVTVRFPSLESAVAAVRAVAQAGLAPANLRMLDRVEAMNTLAGDGTAELLVVGFESADHPVDSDMARSLELCQDHGGHPEGEPAKASGSGAGSASVWRNSFIRMPFFREVLLGYGIVSETFETAVTWDRFSDLHAGVTEAVKRTLATEVTGPTSVSCRFTHVYPDGVAPYFTVIARGTPGRLAEQWWAVKTAASDAIIEHGGTSTHHHAVGRDHMPWYRRERPALFGSMTAAAKAAVDPRGIMNPGVLIDR